jgi:hypothetical protein
MEGANPATTPAAADSTVAATSSVEVIKTMN